MRLSKATAEFVYQELRRYPQQESTYDVALRSLLMFEQWYSRVFQRRECWKRLSPDSARAFVEWLESNLQTPLEIRYPEPEAVRYWVYRFYLFALMKGYLDPNRPFPRFDKGS